MQSRLFLLLSLVFVIPLLPGRLPRQPARDLAARFSVGRARPAESATARRAAEPGRPRQSARGGLRARVVPPPGNFDPGDGGFELEDPPVDSTGTVPEPSPALMLLGLVGIALRRRAIA